MGGTTTSTPTMATDTPTGVANTHAMSRNYYRVQVIVNYKFINFIHKMGGTTTSTPTMAANTPTGVANTHAMSLLAVVS